MILTRFRLLHIIFERTFQFLLCDCSLIKHNYFHHDKLFTNFYPNTKKSQSQAIRTENCVQKWYIIHTCNDAKVGELFFYNILIHMGFTRECL